LIRLLSPEKGAVSKTEPRDSQSAFLNKNAGVFPLSPFLTFIRSDAMTKNDPDAGDKTGTKARQAVKDTKRHRRVESPRADNSPSGEKGVRRLHKSRPNRPDRPDHGERHDFESSPSRKDRLYLLLEKPREESIGRRAFQIATFLRGSHFNHPDMKEIISHLKRAADHGEVEAYKELGVIYYLGDGVDRDCEEAGKWLRKCARHGYYAVQFHLYKMLIHDKLKPAFDGESEYWFEKAKLGGYGRNSHDAFPY
jgi:hypothetical protein